MWEGLAADWVLRRHHSISFATASNARAHAGSLTPTRFFFFLCDMISFTIFSRSWPREATERGEGGERWKCWRNPLDDRYARRFSASLSLCCVCVCLFNFNWRLNICFCLSPSVCFCLFQFIDVKTP
jgi:hypothetical protein